ncbi:MAG: RNA 2',3'-cyclic phosphodiesterase [Actinomycetota bacterium]
MRLFIAFDIPDGHRRGLDRAIDPVRLRLRGARFIPPASWHVTLKFLGEVPEERFGEVRDVTAQSVEPFPRTRSRLTGLGAFPSARRARVVWVGLEDADGVLAALAEGMERDFAAAGFRREERVWRPHLTLARFRTPGPIGEALAEARVEDLPSEPFDVGEVVLFRSHLSPRGASYVPLDRFPLGPAQR